MNIVYASDDNFAEILGVSMLSLFENNKDVADITVYVLDDSIKDQNREKLQSIATNYSRNIQFIPLKELKQKLSSMSQQRGSASTFSRLFLSQLLPSDCERATFSIMSFRAFGFHNERWHIPTHQNKTQGIKSPNLQSQRLSN